MQNAQKKLIGIQSLLDHCTSRLMVLQIRIENSTSSNLELTASYNELNSITHKLEQILKD